MTALVNEPAAAYCQPMTSSMIGGVFSRGGSSSIYLSKPEVFSDQIAEMIQKLNRLKHLEQNWDSYEANPPAPTAIANSLSFLIDNHTLALPFYFLAPDVNGEIMIEFKQDNKAAELYFLPDGENELLLFTDDKMVAESNLNEGFHRLLDFFNP